jgi:hypothetical protein
LYRLTDSAVRYEAMTRQIQDVAAGAPPPIPLDAR